MNKRTSVVFLRAALVVGFAFAAVSLASASAVGPDCDRDAASLPARITASPGGKTASVTPGTKALEVRGKRDTGPAKPRLSRKEVAPPSDAEGLPESGGPGTIAVIRGSVAIIGNEPHTIAVIEDASTGEVFTVTPVATMDLMRGLQGAMVDFTVRLLDEPRADEGRIAGGMRPVNPLSWKIVR